MGKFLDVCVDANPGCPDEVYLRFQTLGEPVEIAMVYCEPEEHPAGLYRVEGCTEGGTPCPARAVPVEDSGDGSAILVYGGSWGLRLTPLSGGEEIGVPCLLLPPTALDVTRDPR